MNYEYYILKSKLGLKTTEYQVVQVNPGRDPLFARSSWEVLAGPFDDRDDAYAWFKAHYPPTELIV